MSLLLLVLVCLFFMPVVVLLLFGVVVLQSAGAVVMIPRQLWEIARDRRTRQNHALEHATVNVLEERFGPQRIAGAAQRDGFTLYRVPFSAEVVLEAAIEGQRRLEGGEKRLAIHGRCGTSMAASTFLLSAAFLAVLFLGRGLSAPTVVAVFVLAGLLSKPAGLWVQRFITARANVEGTTVDEVRMVVPPPVMLFGMLAGGQVPSPNYFVRTGTTQSITVRVCRVGEPGEGFGSSAGVQ